MKWAIRLSVLLVFFLGPDFSWGRGGGGCLEEGTLVLTSKGSIAIEKLQPGDHVMGVAAGCLQSVEVQGVTVVQPETILEILAGGETLRVTAEHPIMIAPGEFRIADFLQIGDTVYLARNGTIFETQIRSIHAEPATRPAYNLMVSPAGTFVSSGFIVHNKGCFLPESMVLRSDGTQIPISTVQEGEELLAFTPDNQLVRTRVQSVLCRTVDEFVVLKTDSQTLRVTADHPFYIGDGRFKTLEVLHTGDRIIAWDGQTLTEQQIVSMETIYGPVAVFNLQTDYPNTFFVSHLAVHNKGGGRRWWKQEQLQPFQFRSSSGSGGSSEISDCTLAFSSFVL